MKTLLIAALLLLWMGESMGKPEVCKDLKEAENECSETEYETYVDCIRKRMKRSTCGGNVDNSCKECDCDYCTNSNDCSNNCNACCANFAQPCSTNYCCYKSCHAQCPNNHCRKSCRQTCTHKINGGGGGSSGGETNVSVDGSLQSNNTLMHNITTVINLHNVINNTNLIDMPVNVNNTNINNITVEAIESLSQNKEVEYIPTRYVNGGGSLAPIAAPSPKESTDKNCCHVISPRQCVPNNVYPFMKCFHYRKQVCNNICKAPIMHAQPHQICDERSSGTPDCHQQIIYIPQPQPRCTYRSTWPYVSCGIQQSNCEGCYSNYGSNSFTPPQNCQGCYDQGYDLGPYYRQGPYYRPPFSNVPSCMQTGTCEGAPDFGGWQTMGAPNENFNFGSPGAYPPVQLPLGGAGYSPEQYDNSYSVEMDPNNLPGSPGLPVMHDLVKPSKLHHDLNDDNEDLIVTNTLTLPDQSTPRFEVVPPLVKIKTIKHTNDDANITMTIKQSKSTRNAEEVFDEPTII